MSNRAENKLKYPDGPYLIRRHNAWFRHNAQGYCTDYAGAGVFSRDTAIGYLDVEGLTIHRFEDHYDEIDQQRNALARLIAMASDFKPDWPEQN